MKRHWITALAACLTLVVLAGALQAEEAKERKRRKGGAEGAKRVRRGPGGPRKMPDIGLSEDQKAKVAEIRKTAMGKMKDAKPAEKREIFAQMRKDIHALFTEEQLDKLQELRKGKGKDGGRGGKPELGLTDEQKEKMDAIRKDTHAKMKDAKPEERKAIMEAAHAEIEKILTAEQLEKFKKHRQGAKRGHGKMPDIGLSDDQKAKIQDIRKKAMADAKDAKGEDKKAIIGKMHKDIKALMTEEQLDKLKKAHKPGRRPGGKGKPEGKGPRGKGKRGEGKRGGERKRPAAE
jgi:Spy/CpxP family protein refolding chaperone